MKPWWPVDVSFYTSPMSEEIRAEGRAEGRAESLLLILASGIHVSGEIREKITGCRDPQLLDQWFSRAVTAATTAEIFAAK